MQYNEVYEIMRRSPGKCYTVPQLTMMLCKSRTSIARMLNSLYKFKLVERLEPQGRGFGFQAYRWRIIDDRN